MLWGDKRNEANCREVEVDAASDHVGAAVAIGYAFSPYASVQRVA